jgi:hypothetical protein
MNGQCLTCAAILAVAGTCGAARGQLFPAAIDLSSLTGTNGFVINGIDVLDKSGHRVSSAGDINGDGIDDVIIGAYRADPNGQSAAGESYVIFGRPSPCDGDVNGDGAVDVNDISAVLFRLGLVPGDFGYQASADANGDGVIDVNDISFVLFRLGDLCP